MDVSQTGKIIGSYAIRERIGGGGVGHVFRAEDIALGRVVAVKALRPELAARPEIVERFRAEAKTLARLNHPNIASVFNLVEDPDGLYMVMEYVEGRTFSALIRAEGRLAIEPCFALFHQALAGIQHAHEAGIVHRDVKGSNLMVDARGVVKVMDFGIARVVGTERMTRVGHLVGTPEYMSPEQIRGKDAGVGSDIYSLGVLLFEMLTGRVPFEREGEFDVMRAQVEQPPPPLRSLIPELPETLEAVLLCALAKRPEERYESIEAFRRALVAAGAPEALPAAGPPTLPPGTRFPTGEVWPTDGHERVTAFSVTPIEEGLPPTVADAAVPELAEEPMTLRDGSPESTRLLEDVPDAARREGLSTAFWTVATVAAGLLLLLTSNGFGLDRRTGGSLAGESGASRLGAFGEAPTTGLGIVEPSAPRVLPGPSAVTAVPAPSEAAPAPEPEAKADTAPAPVARVEAKPAARPGEHSAKLSVAKEPKKRRARPAPSAPAPAAPASPAEAPAPGWTIRR